MLQKYDQLEYKLKIFFNHSMFFTWVEIDTLFRILNKYDFRNSIKFIRELRNKFRSPALDMNLWCKWTAPRFPNFRRSTVKQMSRSSCIFIFDTAERRARICQSKWKLHLKIKLTSMCRNRRSCIQTVWLLDPGLSVTSPGAGHRKFK